MATADPVVIDEREALSLKVQSILSLYLDQLTAFQRGQSFEGNLLRPAEVNAVTNVWSAISDEKIAKAIERANPLASLPDEVLDRIYHRAVDREIQAQQPKAITNGTNGKHL